mmetsp:Transcript_7196/g.21114  ORF Transcript_7196/g.21114 Transcript_7196/m.21114 type:complete len:108 (-) Transcript_7196:1269-1592(-)
MVSGNHFRQSESVHSMLKIPELAVSCLFKPVVLDKQTQCFNIFEKVRKWMLKIPRSALACITLLRMDMSTSSGPLSTQKLRWRCAMLTRKLLLLLPVVVGSAGVQLC